MALKNGYAVSIKGFIPVDPSDLNSHRKALDAITKAKDGEDAGPMFDLIEVEQFDVTPTSRRKAETP